MGVESIRRDNPRQQGAIGVASAITWFTSNGYEVFTPIGEPSRFDLVVVDPEGCPHRVEVKTSTYRGPKGSYSVRISTCGGNRSWTGLVKTFDPDEVDLLYVLTDSGEEYVIPSSCVRARTRLSLGPAMEHFRVAVRGQPTEQLQLDG